MNTERRNKEKWVNNRKMNIKVKTKNKEEIKQKISLK